MLNPYRKHAAEHHPAAIDRRDDLILGALMIALSSWRVALALATHEQFGVEATAALIMSCLGLVLVFSSLARR